VAEIFIATPATILPPNLARLLRHAAVGLHVFLRNGQDISIDVFHNFPFSNRISLGLQTANADYTAPQIH
jgi:hypothetical protein